MKQAMVFSRRHFVPNPVPFSRTGFRAKCKRPQSIHTRYDGAGRQVEVLTNFTGATPGSVTHNYYSGQQVIETRDGTPDAFAASLPVHYQYIWSARGNNSLILRDDFTQTPGTTAARLYYLNDANFNVTALVGNVSGVWQPVERYAYDPYGNVTVYDPTWATVRTSGSSYSTRSCSPAARWTR